MEDKTKIKITEVPVTKTIKKKILNADGTTGYEDVQIKAFKEVKFVSGWLRFAHFIIDYIAYLIFSVIVGLFLGILNAAGITDFNFGGSEFELGSRLFEWIFLHPLFYFFWEFFFQKTPGKYVTGCRVVNEYGEKASAGQIIGRSFARSIPFEPFSCLGERGWHDTMSNTYLIRESDLKELKAVMMIEDIGKPAETFWNDENSKDNSEI